MKVLVVEDMEWIRKGILKLISELDNGIDKVYEAINGIEALAIIEEHEPEIIITDIRMPEKNGLQLIEEAKNIVPYSEFIIITGYAEFEYAKKAIDMGVKGFLLKPINDVNFHEVLAKTMDELHNKVNYELMAKEKQLLQDDKNQLQLNNAINKIFLDDRRGKLQIVEDQAYILLLIHLGKKQDKEAIYQHLEEVTGKHIGKIKWQLVENYTDQGEYFLILYTSKSNVLTIESNKIARDIYQDLQPAFSSLVISISTVKHSIRHLLYKEAKDALLYKLFQPEEGIYSYNNKEYTGNIKELREKIGILQLILEKRNLEDAASILREVLSTPQLQKCSPNYLINIFYLIIDAMVKGFNLSMEQIETYNLIKKRRLFEVCRDLEEVHAYFLKTIKRLAGAEKTTPVSGATVEQIKNFIHNNYAKNLSTNELAKQFNLSASYLSTMFKKHTSKTISQYIIQIRMKRACTLLDETNLTVGDISKSVGYEDVQYFYRIFKKWCNLTPLGYRNRS